MLFLLGLDKLGHKEKATLVAQLNCISGCSLLLEGVSTMAKKTQDLAFSLVNRGAKYCGKSAVKNTTKFQQKMEWDASFLLARINREIERMTNESPEVVQSELQANLLKLVNLKEFDHNAVACATLHEAAKGLDIDPGLYADAVSLEAVVFEAVIREMIESLQQKMKSFSDEDQECFEDLIREELSQLSETEKVSMRKVLGIDELSAKAVSNFFRTATVAAIVQLAIGSSGFGAFLFLTSIISAFSLLFGITFPFVVYTTATSVLSLALSIPFFLFLLCSAGGWLIISNKNKLNAQIAKLLVVTGHATLLEKCEV